jgi:hypothetical protein
MRETEEKAEVSTSVLARRRAGRPIQTQARSRAPPFALWDSTKPALSTDAEASTQAETLVRTARRASKRRCGELCERLVSDRRDRLWRLGDANTPYVPTAQQASTMNHQRTRLNFTRCVRSLSLVSFALRGASLNGPFVTFPRRCRDVGMLRNVSARTTMRTRAWVPCHAVLWFIICGGRSSASLWPAARSIYLINLVYPP